MKQQLIILKVKENHWLAKIAAWKLKSASGMAITVGNTIYLHKASVHDLYQNKRWFQHEIAHVLQFQQLGFFCFLTKYVWESIRKGYYNNRFEVEARSFEYMNFKNLSYRVLIKT